MDPDETDTLPSGGTESVMPESDTAEDLTTYYDPDDDQDTVAGGDETATDEGTEEAETPEKEPEVEVFVDSSAKVRLADGTVTTVAELTKERMMQRDYTHKTTELATVRKSLEADLQLVEGITQTFIDHLTKMVPAMPDAAMALRNPSGYVAAKAQHEAAMAQVQQLIELGKQSGQIKGKLSEADKAAQVAEANAALGDMFPSFRTPEGRTKFLQGASTAAEQVGFSFAELQEVTDPRMFALAHWANEGLKAAKARETAKTKVSNVPPATPRKPGQPATGPRNADAMRRLTKSGSMRDALAIDFE